MRKIVVGVDLSAESRLAAEHALDLARRTGAEVLFTLVHVAPEPPVRLVPSEPARAAFYDAINEQLAHDRRELDLMFERWTDQGATVSQLVVAGDPDEALPRVASETGADLIAVGSHGRTGLQRVLMGSVAERVARLAPCSVLVARGDAPNGGYDHIVVGTDFTSLARVALRKAIAVAAPRARLDLVHCWRPPFYSAPVGAPMMVSSGLEAYQEASAGITAQGAELVAIARDGADLDVQFHSIEAIPAHGLVDFARDVRADLIALGSHGRRGIKRFLLGSVAEATARHAPCSTLIARP